MNVYLCKFNIADKTAYKVGYTKWYITEKRFSDSQYSCFDNIEIIDTIYISNEDYQIAKKRCLFVEGFLKCFFKKNFRLEQYFNKPKGFFNGLSGITEMFVLNNMTEQEMIEIFQDVKKHVKGMYG
jgi:hypothetical protein